MMSQQELAKLVLRVPVLDRDLETARKFSKVWNLNLT